MAEYLGVKEIYLKDESYRFGLNAFKVLGGSFSMALHCQRDRQGVSELPYSVLTSDQLRKEFGQATFFTATDGNHGRGVAWAPTAWARRQCYICLRVHPDTSSEHCKGRRYR